MSKKNELSGLAKNEEKLAFKLLLPTILILILVAFYPLFQVFYTSFTDKTFASNKKTSFVGIQNYKQLLSMTIKELPPIVEDGKAAYESPVKILPKSPSRYKEVKQFDFMGKRYVLGATDPDFISSIVNTVVFTLVSVFLETFLGIIIAIVVNSKFKGRGVMRAVMLVPWAVITVVSARMWQWMLSPTRVGVFNTIFDKFGVGGGQIAFLSESSYQLPSIIAVDVWKTTPFMALLILAGLQLIPDELYEAADIDGSSKIHQFFNITLPLLKPSLAVALVFRTLDSLRVFDVFHVLLANRKYSMASYNYFQLIGNRNMGLASSIGVIIFIFISIFAVIYIKMLGVDGD